MDTPPLKVTLYEEALFFSKTFDYNPFLLISPCDSA